MTASLETLVVAAYVFATSLPIPRPGPAGETTDHELIALSVAQAAMGISSDRQFLGLVPKVLPGWLARCPTSPATTAGCGGSPRRSRPCN